MLVGISMMRDEADICETVVRHLLAEGIDRVIVADNLSTDGTGDILRSIGPEVTVVDDPVVAYLQSEKMTTLAHRAAELGADWVVPFDADELLYSPHGRLCDVLTDRIEPVQWVRAFEHVPMEWDDPDEPNPVVRIKHRKPQPKPFMKCVFRYDPHVRIWQGNHQVDHPGPFGGPGLLELREFQYRTLQHATRKVRNGKAAYDATSMPLSEGSHWREMGAWSDEEIALWWKGYCAQDVILDPAPLRA